MSGTDSTLFVSTSKENEEEGEGEERKKKASPVEWKDYTINDEEYSIGYRILLKHSKVHV